MGELSGGVGGRSGVILIVPAQGLGISIKKLIQVLGVFERCISSYVHSFRVLGISTHIYATKLTFSYIIFSNQCEFYTNENKSRKWSQ